MYTQNTNEFAATNLRSSPKRHDRLGGPLTVRSPMDSEHKKKKKRVETRFLLFEPLAGLEPAIYERKPPIYIRNGVTLHTENQYSKLVIC